MKSRFAPDIGKADKAVTCGRFHICQVSVRGIEIWNDSYHADRAGAVPQRRDIEMHCFPQCEVFGLIASAQCNLLEAADDTAAGRYGEWVSRTVVVLRALE
jgi:hypothetical protein